MTAPLDPRFMKIVAKMRSTTFEPEKVSARKLAEEIARACGRTFEQALAEVERSATKASASAQAPRQPTWADGLRDIFQKMEDEKEAAEPGYKARVAKEKQQKCRDRLVEKDRLIKRYGSFEAAIAPCARERLLLKAVARWRTVNEAPHQRWTDKLDGSRCFWVKEAPAHVRAAIATAYPLPTTFRAARAEAEYWDARNKELETVLLTGRNGEMLHGGDTCLDKVAALRREMVRDLADRDIPVTTLAELYERAAMHQAAGADWHEDADAIFRDLKTLAEAEARNSDPSTAAEHPSTTRKGPDLSTKFRGVDFGQIEATLRANPSMTDREVARTLGCSPTTVGKVRRAAGLVIEKRSVRRGGQMYDMRPAGRRQSEEVPQ